MQVLLCDTLMVLPRTIMWWQRPETQARLVSVSEADEKCQLPARNELFAAKEGKNLLG